MNPRLTLFFVAIAAACPAYASQPNIIPATMTAIVASASVPNAGNFSTVTVIRDHPLPKLSTGEILIKVEASSVNPVDWKILEANAGLGLGFPHTLGFDVAGTVAALGPGATGRLAVGDRVWADLGKNWLFRGPGELGAWAEYAAADETQVGLMPANTSFADAGALPLVSLTDLQALRKTGAPWKAAAGGAFTVVITSGSGGTGVSAIQMAVAYGATRVVTATTPDNFALLKSLGATDVVDYRTSSVFDVVANNSVQVVYDNYGAPGTADAAMPSLDPNGGVFIFLPGKGGALSKHPKQGVKQINFGLCDSSHYADMDALKVLVEGGHLRAHIQQSFALEDAVEAMRTSFGGKVVGKLSIDMSSTRHARKTENKNITTTRTVCTPRNDGEFAFGGCLPPWTPTYNMSRSTIIMYCNYSGPSKAPRNA